MRDRIKKLWHYHRNRRKPAHVTATIDATGNDVRVLCGPASFQIRSPEHDLGQREHFDFVLFGLAAISMSRNMAISLDAPVSQAGVDTIKGIANLYELWSIPRLAPLRVEARHVVEEPQPRKATGTALCLSGGTDSLAAAVELKARGELTHGVLIAGFDYPDFTHPSFLDLRQRVQAQADLLGITLVTLETDIRATGVKWELLHGLCLAMGLHYCAPLIGKAALAMDFTRGQDHIAHPWGSSIALTEKMGTALLPMIPVGAEYGRTDKIGVLMREAPELVPHLSVCWQTDSGGSCGACPKCIRTRLNFIAAGGSEPDIFAQKVSIIDALDGLAKPRKMSKIRNDLIFMVDIMQNLPEGDLRNAVARQVETLRRAYVGTMP
ncbi:hypothetical protein HMH01_14210 [Halovulum dunhuangense]|uniref:7-cyano-7-deazaguanine synthase in queuosine biosynthesis n=1 Tax=Halovulum dunhuangense TaxID=1505036 RepID=A0A849L614_9RHOB|nr:hypothetical protein [Halovulum dunhuangense]NNU81590.1 hypothetical protein [Halovulum dunhuangense]